MVHVQTHTTATGILVDLADRAAADVAVAGAKAAKLAQAAAAGLPVLPGFVLVAAGGRRLSLTPDDMVELYDMWSALTDGGEQSLVVRSSSTAEDGDTSSMAGLFESVLDVRGWTDFIDAVERVRRSAGDAPMGVLVQPLLRPVVSGVLFGADPVTGDTSRTVIAVVEGAPHQLVSGHATGTYHVLNRHGRTIEVREGTGGAPLTAEQRRALVRLARRLERHFGAPQDVEWAWDARRGLVLLQTRPITAGIGVDAAAAVGPLLGPGPIAETFPEPLAPLEEDLWLTPLGAGLGEALALAGIATRRRLARSPIVRTVGGRAVVDLGLLGLAPSKHPILHKFDPRPPARRLVAAWRVGRLRVALPGLARDLIEGVDSRLRAVPPLGSLDDASLVGVLERVSQSLAAVHGHEVLMGLLIRSAGSDQSSGGSAAGEALRVLTEARLAGAGDDETMAAAPLVLALTPPRIGPRPTLPPTSSSVAARAAAVGPVDEVVELREALRLRVRWLQELSARAAFELGRRLAPACADVAVLRLDELRAAVSGAGMPADVASRRRPVTPPLPTQFRLTEAGDVVAVADSTSSGEGTGAGGGRAAGAVHHLTPASSPPKGSVLVVQALEPGLVAWLPDAAAVVAETGSPLSHLAILAREMGVPVVVGVAGARDRFEEGARVVVDGRTGEVAAA